MISEINLTIYYNSTSFYSKIPYYKTFLTLNSLLKTNLKLIYKFDINLQNNSQILKFIFSFKLKFNLF